MFLNRYFAGVYFAPRYFPRSSGTPRNLVWVAGRPVALWSFGSPVPGWAIGNPISNWEFGKPQE